MIVVPPNVNPGDTFCLEVHHDAEGGAMVTVAEVNSLLLMFLICFEGSYILYSFIYFRTTKLHKPTLSKQAARKYCKL